MKISMDGNAIALNNNTVHKINYILLYIGEETEAEGAEVLPLFTPSVLPPSDPPPLGYHNINAMSIK